MKVWLHPIETDVATHSYDQEHARRKMMEWHTSPEDQRLIRAIYKSSGIHTRQTVVSSFDAGADTDFFLRKEDGSLHERGTAYRNDLYAKASRRISVDLARKLLARSPDLDLRRITHVITASCTGFYCPGPDYHIVRELGLNPATQRYHLGFMGCYAAVPALRMATQFCQATPDARVLVMCLELCSLHLHLNGDPDSLLANALFSDGAGAALVSTTPPPPGQTGYSINGFSSFLLPEGESHMTWTLGDQGFDIGLSSYVPKVIGTNIRALIEPALQEHQLDTASIGTWAIHPGGKSIVDRFQNALTLRPEQISASREVLRRHGNMSSATLMFVLKEILNQSTGNGSDKVCAIAFGPGLTIEMALLERGG